MDQTKDNQPEDQAGHRPHGPYHMGRFMRWHNLGLLARIGIIIGGIVAAVAGFILFGFGLAALWNALMPAIFNLPAINFWQAWGLMLLCSLLFKSPGAHRGGGDWRRKRQLRHKMGQFNQTDPGQPQ